ncbi:MAG TPA: hypothetical protein VM557_12005 [Thermoanaerobaculia bacterium]|nr:hypothetical protein [Thermoanaerobaculia bacterium]
MTELERHLKETLKRTEPPAGFADRVAEKAFRAGAPARESSWWSRTWMRAAAALLVVVVGAGVWGGYRMEQRKRGEAAAAELMLALEITSGKMNLVKKNLNEGPARPAEGRTR